MIKSLNNKYKNFLVLIISISFLFFSISFIKADDADSVSGYARDDTYGWISFNCNNDTSGDLDGFDFIFPFELFRFTCGLSHLGEGDDYGVNIDDNGDFSGFAWGETSGWIDFAPVTATPPKYSLIDYSITGTAKILSSNGWLDLEGGAFAGSTIEPVSGDWSGYGWNDTSNFMSMNCQNDSSCGGISFSVNHWTPLELEDLSVPNWNSIQACSGSGAKKAVFKWQLSRDGITDYQDHFQVIIDDDPVMDDDPVIWDSGKITSTAIQYSCPNMIDACDIDYDTTYYWWVKFWDSKDRELGWIQFDTDDVDHFLTDNVGANTVKNPDDPNFTFTTYLHEFPDTQFSVEEKANKKFTFTDESDYYITASPTTSITCNDVDCGILWSTTSNAKIDYPTSSVTDVTVYNSSSVIDLDITDQDGYTCRDSSSPLSYNFGLPDWREVSPASIIISPPSITTCDEYCVSLDYSSGLCKLNAGSCPNVYEPAGDTYCPGTANKNICCCKP